MVKYLNVTGIDWCHFSWNDQTGCDKDPLCVWCYARREAGGKAAAFYPRGFVPEFHPERLSAPSKLKTPTIIFWGSMADNFSKAFKDETILMSLDAIRRCPQHKFIALTKQPHRLVQLEVHHGGGIWPENLWLGVSVPDRASVRYLDVLRSTDVPHRIVSFEPLLEDVGAVDLEGIGWVIIGALTGSGAYQPDPGWVSNIICAAGEAAAPVFVKRNLKGTSFIDYKQFPLGFPVEDLRYCRGCGVKLRRKRIEWGTMVCDRCAKK